jgi:hypothetical protein
MNPFAGLIQQIVDHQMLSEPPRLSLMQESEQAILDWIKTVGRPVTWIDISDEFGLTRRQAALRISAIRDKLHVDRSGNMKGLPARYTWRGA